MTPPCPDRALHLFLPVQSLFVQEALLNCLFLGPLVSYQPAQPRMMATSTRRPHPRPATGKTIRVQMWDQTDLEFTWCLL